MLTFYYYIAAVSLCGGQPLLFAVMCYAGSCMRLCAPVVFPLLISFMCCENRKLCGQNKPVEPLRRRYLKAEYVSGVKPA